MSACVATAIIMAAAKLLTPPSLGLVEGISPRAQYEAGHLRAADGEEEPLYVPNDRPLAGPKDGARMQPFAPTPLAGPAHIPTTRSLGAWG